MRSTMDLTTNSAERYRQLVEAITDYAIYMLDVDGHVANWNAGAQRIKGYDASDIIGQHFSLFYTPEDRAAGVPEQALRTAAQQGKFETESWRLRKDGSRFWAHVVIDPIPGADGEVIGYAKITRDLTERKLAQEALRKSEDQFSRLVLSVTDYAIYMLDPDGLVSSWNAGAQRIKGYAPDEIIGKHFSTFYTPDDQQSGQPQQALATALRDGRFAAEGWRMRKNGERFRANVLIEAIRDEGGDLIGYAKITRDITEREEAQRALDDAKIALAQAQKMEAIGQLTGGIAHDFNNLLMAIGSSLTLLRKRLPPDPQSLRLLDNASQGVDRGATLTQRMLAFARRQELSVGRVHLPELLRNMTDLVQRSIGPEWPITMTIPMGLPAATADTNQLEMAILNLVVNARDAMPSGGEISIAATRQTLGDDPSIDLPPGDYVCLSVRDHGHGMDAETLRKATEPFFTTKGIGKGTGLGLPMVHGFTQQIGGALTLESEAGAGTTARLWLPLAGAPVITPAAEPECAEPALRHLTILAVDDDPLVLMNTIALLEDLDHEVIGASSGTQALELFKTTDVDLVITDQAMPGMLGTELSEAILALRPAMPIIIASGYGEGMLVPPGHILRLKKTFQQSQLTRVMH